MTEILVSADVVSEIMGDVSARRVRQLAAEGIIPKAGRGKYDLVAVAAAYIRWQAEAFATTGATGDLAEQRARLVSLQADRLERENSVAEGRLVDIEEITERFTRHFYTARNKLLGIPSRAAPLAAHRDAPGVFSVLTELVREVLTELSNHFGEEAKNEAEAAGENFNEEDFRND